MTQEAPKGLGELPIQTITELTLEKPVKMKPQKIKHYIKPVWGKEKFKVPIGKFTIIDQLEAQKIDWKMGPGAQNNNLFFLAWVADRLIKKVNPYWDKPLHKLIKMFCEETIKELDAIFKASYSEELKKKLKERIAEEGSPLLGKI